jgi:hypothetical protein
LFGSAAALDAPVRQTFVAELVVTSTSITQSH